MLRLRSERGQGTLESVGVIGVAALLIVAVIAATAQANPAVVGNIKDGICRVVTLGQGTCSSAPEIRTSDDYVPPEEWRGLRSVWRKRADRQRYGASGLRRASPGSISTAA